jgi:hypothetical protein
MFTINAPVNSQGFRGFNVDQVWSFENPMHNRVAVSCENAEVCRYVLMTGLPCQFASLVSWQAEGILSYSQHWKVCSGL